MVSICVTVKNRSRIEVEGRSLALFANCAKSIRDVARTTHIKIQLVVSDWRSDDWPLQDWLAEHVAPVPAIIVQMEGEFNRGRGRNAAADHSEGDVIWFIDADMLISTCMFHRGLEVVHSGASYFPISFSFDGPEHQAGFWRIKGHGNCAVSRTFFKKVRWPEYETWGKEDDDFYEAMCNLGPVIREPMLGFYHQWHPNEITWKDRYFSGNAKRI